jgi:hypothetical protein
VKNHHWCLRGNKERKDRVTLHTTSTRYSEPVSQNDHHD